MYINKVKSTTDNTDITEENYYFFQSHVTNYYVFTIYFQI